MHRELSQDGLVGSDLRDHLVQPSLPWEETPVSKLDSSELHPTWS